LHSGKILFRVDEFQERIALTKVKVPHDGRRGLKEYAEFERLYTELRRSGPKLADAERSATSNGRFGGLVGRPRTGHAAVPTR
jgi:hypothetical protein